MAKILMKQTKPGSMDGITINLYHAGKEYEIGDNEISQSLADTFVNAHWATMVRLRVAPSEMAVVDVVPEVKNITVDKEEKESLIVEAKNTRVYELAGLLKKNWKEISELAEKLGIEANKPQSGLTNSDVEKIKKGFIK